MPLQPEKQTHLTTNELRDVLRFWATGVSIVSAAHGGVQHGMTVNSFTSLSLEPPLVSVALERITRTHGLVDLSGAFGVSFLAEEQKAVSERFSGMATELQNRYAGLKAFTMETGSPLLEGALAWLDCRVTERHTAGTHTVFFAEVIAARFEGDAPPLLYFNRGYRKLST
ncbi:MAG: flavin reductase family protein [Chloroflexi bacterium]|nr:flavin reductase family protein [Chloroflexota bacterium]